MESGMWMCEAGKAWQINGAVDVTQPHDVMMCPGDCAQHPLLTCEANAIQANFMMLHAAQYGTTWGDILLADLAEAESRLTVAQRAARDAAEVAELAQREVNHLASRMFNYAETQKLLNSRGKGRERHIGKIDEPCRWLYCDESAPKTQWTKNGKGELCAPVRKCLTGAQCWAHEYKDPKTGQWIKPHTCKRLHPNEDGWRDQWDTDRTHKPSAADSFFNNRMANIPAPVIRTAPAAVAKPKAKKAPVDMSAW